MTVPGSKLIEYKGLLCNYIFVLLFFTHIYSYIIIAENSYFSNVSNLFDFVLICFLIIFYIWNEKYSFSVNL